eukprot:10429656-Lingulodinium_polyedra.AAC.1
MRSATALGRASGRTWLVNGAKVPSRRTCSAVATSDRAGPNSAREPAGAETREWAGGFARERERRVQVSLEGHRCPNCAPGGSGEAGAGKRGARPRRLRFGRSRMGKFHSPWGEKGG